MKVGDLVDFHTKAWVFKHAESQYANPGLVLRVVRHINKDKFVADIYWRDGRITSEDNSYLRPAEER